MHEKLRNVNELFRRRNCRVRRTGFLAGRFWGFLILLLILILISFLLETAIHSELD